MRTHVAHGDTGAALLQYQRLERVLDRDLGVALGPAVRQLHERITATGASTPDAGPRRQQRPEVNVAPMPSAAQHRAVDDLVAELTELTRRQTILLQTLARHRSGGVAPASVITNRSKQ
jgi:hypothetical protein